MMKEEMIALPIDKIVHKEVPEFPELTVDAAYQIFKNDLGTMKHLTLMSEGKRKLEIL
jgi:hypothetical protein